MLRPLILAAAATLSLTSAALAECPPPPDHSAELNALIAEAQTAGNEREGSRLSDAMWALWTKAPDEAAQSLLDRGMTARRYGDYLSAIDAFTRLTEYCPDYAEGYNQRAFIFFLQENFTAALPDLDAAIARNPRHVAALAGRALTLMGLGRDAEAQESLAEALALNPWLPERHLRQPPGEEL